MYSSSTIFGSFLFGAKSLGCHFGLLWALEGKFEDFDKLYSFLVGSTEYSMVKWESAILEPLDPDIVGIQRSKVSLGPMVGI